MQSGTGFRIASPLAEVQMRSECQKVGSDSIGDFAQNLPNSIEKHDNSYQHQLLTFDQNTQHRRHAAMPSYLLDMPERRQKPGSDCRILVRQRFGHEMGG